VILLIGVHLRVRSLEAVTVAGPTGEFGSVVPVATITIVGSLAGLIAVVAGVQNLDSTPVRRGYLWGSRNVFSQLGINRFGVGPAGDSPLARSEPNAAFVFAQFSVFEVMLFVGTGTAGFERVNTVLRTALRDD